MKTKVEHVSGVDWDLSDSEELADYNEIKRCQDFGLEVEVTEVTVDMGDANASYYRLVSPTGQVLDPIHAVHIVDAKALEAFYKEHCGA